MGKMDSMMGTKGASGEKEPKGATSSDRSGERKAKSMRGGVATVSYTHLTLPTNREV